MKTTLLTALLLMSFASLGQTRKSYTQIREERIVFFNENPYEALNDYDEVELDLLYQDLPHLTILELFRKYPELRPRELEVLKSRRKD